MTKGPWRVEKSGSTHYHVIMSDDEVLDVVTKDDAKIIAQVPELIKLLRYVKNVNFYSAYKLAKQISRKLER